MNSLDKWRIKGIFSKIIDRVKITYASAPEVSQAPKLVGTGWSYSEWVYFHGASVVWREHPDALGRIVKTAGPELCDFLLAFAIRTDASARKAAFTSAGSLRELLVLVAQVVLERVPSQFITSDWIEKKAAQGTQPLLCFRV